MVSFCSFWRQWRKNWRRFTRPKSWRLLSIVWNRWGLHLLFCLQVNKSFFDDNAEQKFMFGFLRILPGTIANADFWFRQLSSQFINGALVVDLMESSATLSKYKTDFSMASVVQWLSTLPEGNLFLWMLTVTDDFSKEYRRFHVNGKKILPPEKKAAIYTALVKEHVSSTCFLIFCRRIWLLLQQHQEKWIQLSLFTMDHCILHCRFQTKSAKLWRNAMRNSPLSSSSHEQFSVTLERWMELIFHKSFTKSLVLCK